jgi:hypothetical protein
MAQIAAVRRVPRLRSLPNICEQQQRAGRVTTSRRRRTPDRYDPSVATIGQVERQIHNIERFEVQILYDRDGRDVRSDKTGLPKYKYQRALKGSKNVREWREERFEANYHSYKVNVLRRDGRVANGRTLLTTVRDDYLDC